MSSALQILFNLGLLAAAAALFGAAGALPDSRWEPLGSGTYPRIVLASLGLMALFSLATHAGRGRAEVAAHGRQVVGLVTDTLREARLVIATFGLFGAFVFSIPAAGFTLAAFVFIFLAQILLGPRTTRSVLLAALIAGVTAYGIAQLFASQFNIFLPAGRIWS